MYRSLKDHSVHNNQLLALTYIEPDKNEVEQQKTEFENFLELNGVPEPCRCIKTEVEECFYDYYETKQLGKYYKIKKEHRGIKNIIDLYFKLNDIMSYDGIISLCDILIFIQSIKKDSVHRVCDYMETRFTLTYFETHAVLAYLDMMNFVTHDTILRYPCISDHGIEFLMEHNDETKILKPMIQCRLTQKNYDSFLPHRWIKNDKRDQKKKVIELISHDIEFNDIENTILFSHLVENMNDDFCFNDIVIETEVYLVNEWDVDEYLNGNNKSEAIYKINKNKMVNFTTISNASGAMKQMYVDENGKFFDEKKMILQCII